MSEYQIAPVSDSASVSAAELSQVCAALQYQVQNHFYPVWQIMASVTSYAALEDVVPGSWVITIQDDLNQPGVEGFHISSNMQPFALIQYGPNWSLTASHECLEMIADPWGNASRTGASPLSEQGTVSYVMEICDPVQDLAYSYSIYGQCVSNFYFPNYFDSAVSVGTRYDFCSKVTEPLEVLPNGYVSWHDPSSGDYFQLRGPASGGNIANIGPYAGEQQSIREFVDSRTVRSVPQADLLFERSENLKLERAQVAKRAALDASRFRESVTEVKRRNQDNLIHER